MPRKFDGVPTEPLFDMEPSAKQRKPTVKSVAFGKCPHCTAERTGVVRQGNHLVWRQHTFKTWADTNVTCVSSGVAVCVAAEVVPLHPSKPLRCKHDE